jgi:hypothetical protein
VSSLAPPASDAAAYAPYARAQAIDGVGGGGAVQFPRIGIDPETVFLWSKTLRAMRFLGQHFFRRTEVQLAYILLLFGSVFAFLWYLRLSNAPVSSFVLELIYAVRGPGAHDRASPN